LPCSWPAASTTYPISPGISSPPNDIPKDEYEIPDKDSGKWIKTNPEKHKEQSTARNKELIERFVPLVKMAKGWNRANGKPVKPSFLIEVMAQGLVDPPFGNSPMKSAICLRRWKRTLGEIGQIRQGSGRRFQTR
jgi:hypothetical protein